MATSLERQLQILELRSKGYSQQETAKQVGIHRRTLETDLQAFAEDNGFKGVNLAVLIDFAMGKGWIEGPNERLEVVLSDPELAVAKLVAQGFNNQQIARRLFLSVNTVMTHLKRIFKKTGVKNRLQLAAMVQRQSL